MNSKTFEVHSGALRVTDPCYTTDVWCSGTLENVKNGTWVASVELCNEPGWGERVARLSTHHVEDGPEHLFVKSAIDVGVDSGQAGFFDLALYPVDENLGEYGDTSTFYGKVCSMTLADQWGVLPFGVVSSSGFGDGSYDCYAARNKEGQVVAAYLLFIGDDEDEGAEEQ